MTIKSLILNLPAQILVSLSDLVVIQTLHYYRSTENVHYAIILRSPPLPLLEISLKVNEVVCMFILKPQILIILVYTLKYKATML